MVMILTCQAFKDGAPIQPIYTCHGRNQSPELEWSGVPAGAKSLALILEDPDAPSGTFYHWSVYALSPAAVKLPGTQPKTGNLGEHGKQGTNSFGRIGYDGPCPPPGKAHRYYLVLYALDCPINLNAGAGIQEVKSAMQGHILDQARTWGTFQVP